MKQGLDLLERSSRGELQVLLVQGEPGIGKSRLIDELLLAAREAEFSMFRGAADEIERRRPFRVFLDALDIDRDSDDPPRAEIARLLAEGTGADVEGRGDPGFVVAEQLIHLIEAEALRQSTVLALEDIHWADPASIETAGLLLRRLADLPLLVVTTLRSTPRPRDVDAFLERQLANDAVLLSLSALADDEVRDLASQLLGSPPGPNLWTQLRGAGGNPLFVRELIAALENEGGLRTTANGVDVDGPRLPEDLKDTILRRVRLLSRSTMELLRVAAILGSSFSPADLATLVGRPVAALLEQMDEAVESAILAARGDRLEFRHAVIRDVIYDMISPAVRGPLHLDASRALAQAGASLDEVVPHLLQGVTRGDEEGVALMADAALSSRNSAPAVAVELLQRILELIPPDHPRRVEFEAALIRPLGRRGRFAEAEELARRLLAAPHPLSLERWIREGLQLALVRQGKFEACRSELEQVVMFSELDDSQRVMWESYLGNMRLLTGDVAGAKAVAQDAFRSATAAGDEEMAVYNLATQSWVKLAEGDVRSGVELCGQAVTRHDRITSNPQNVFIYWGGALLEADRLDEAVDAFHTGTRRDAEVGDVSVLGVYQWSLGAVNFFRGRWDDALAEIEAGHELASEATVARPAILMAYAAHGLIAMHRNDLESAEQHISAGEAELQELGPQVGVDLLWWARSLLLEAHGNTEEALATLEASWELTAAIRYFLSWRMVAPDLVRLYLLHDNRDRAATITSEAEEGATRSGGVASATAAALTCRGLLNEEPEDLREAVVQWERGGRPPQQAAALEYAAEATAANGRSDEAIVLWRDASSLYRSLGALRDVDRINLRLRAHGVRAGRTTRRAAATTGWASLTDSELRVVRLVSEGLTNREVADRLFISRYTVDSHLRHVFAKLGLSSRVELAAAALRSGEIPAAS